MNCKIWYFIEPTDLAWPDTTILRLSYSYDPANVFEPLRSCCSVRNILDTGRGRCFSLHYQDLLDPIEEHSGNLRGNANGGRPWVSHKKCHPGAWSLLFHDPSLSWLLLGRQCSDLEKPASIILHQMEEYRTTYIPQSHASYDQSSR